LYKAHDFGQLSKRVSYAKTGGRILTIYMSLWRIFTQGVAFLGLRWLRPR